MSEVKVLRLSTGEDVIAKVDSGSEKVTLEKPKDKVVFMTEPKDEIKKSYEANTSRIIQPNKELITETKLPS